MTTNRDFTLNEIILSLRRRAPLVTAIFFLTLITSFYVVLNIPHVYQSTGTISIESQQVQQDLLKAGTENFAAERLDVLKQRVMVSDNLFKIIQQHKLFGFGKSKKSKSELVSLLRKNIAVVLLQTDTGQWTDKTAFAFQVSFQYGKPEIAYQVTNEVVSLFLDANEKERRQRATETAEFFENEVNKQKVILENIEREVSAYKRAHSGSLPEDRGVHAASMLRVEADLRETEREYHNTQAELRTLQVELESAKAGIGIAETPGGTRLTPATELENLKLEYVKLSGIYNENHPSLRNLQRKIDLLEKSLQSTAPEKSLVTQRSVMIDKVQAKIDAAESRLVLLTQDAASLRAKLASLEGQVVQSSQTEGALTTLLRTYEDAKSRSEEVKAKLANAKMTEKMELENKGERLKLIEAPIMPETPIKPNRLVLSFIGFLFSIFFAIAIALILENFDKRLRGVETLASVLQLQPLVVIPYIKNKTDTRREKQTVYYMIAAGLLTIIVLILFMHFFLMPLDVLIPKTLDRIL